MKGKDQWSLSYWVIPQTKPFNRHRCSMTDPRVTNCCFSKWFPAPCMTLSAKRRQWVPHCKVLLQQVQLQPREGSHFPQFNHRFVLLSPEWLSVFLKKESENRNPGRSWWRVLPILHLEKISVPAALSSQENWNFPWCMSLWEMISLHPTAQLITDRSSRLRHFPTTGSTPCPQLFLHL